MRIFVTGGAGYIGSHTVLALSGQGHDVTIYDNFSNASRTVVGRVERLSKRKLELVEGDLLDEELLTKAIDSADPDSVIHFAGLKSVGESASSPLTYYSNNVAGTINLLRAMDQKNVRSLVFSSSATVYRTDNPSPLTENMPIGAGNPYGRTKQHIEEILRDVAVADRGWNLALLRYFNPAGAHTSGTIGEDPAGIPNNLVPFVAQVAVGRRPKVSVFGADYPTSDGTGIRDYVHVADLADGHIAALDYIHSHSGIHTWNLGTGHGTSVLEVIEAFSRASGRSVPYEIAPRRPGDAAVSYADVTAAKRDLGWEAKRSIREMCEDHWRWQKMNPYGYGSA